MTQNCIPIASVTASRQSAAFFTKNEETQSCQYSHANIEMEGTAKYAKYSNPNMFWGEDSGCFAYFAVLYRRIVQFQ
jgi:hypothetical protein